MSDARPTVTPQLVAQAIEATPDRVRRRLDKAPDAATRWNWQQADDGWSVDTGGELVVLDGSIITSLDQVRCTCLLSPKCFHVLACLTVLEVALSEQGPASEAPDAGSDQPDADDEAALPENLLQPTEKQRRAAEDITASVAQILRVGVANAGMVIQSGLLRAVHQCRAEGLYRAASVGMRVLAGVSQNRARAVESDPGQFAEDVADLLETAHHIIHWQDVERFWMGTARRQQFPVRPRKLHGLFAEPILTRSGFAGAAAYFLGEDGQIYSASDVRPGDAQLARDAYLGGIEIGPLIQPAKQLARGLYLGTDLTASADGRLGRGKKIKFVQQGASSWETDTIAQRFEAPLADQWNAIYARAALPADARGAGWDFVFITGTVVGASGPELLLQPDGEETLLRLAIANDEAALLFRENLRMLSHAPGLAVRIIGRAELADPTVVHALAAGEIVKDDAENHPRLELPASLEGRICLGFDDIQRKWLINAQAVPVVLGEHIQPSGDDPLAVLRRRWVALLLSGAAVQRQTATGTLAAETALLSKSGFLTGAALLDAMSRGPGQGPSTVAVFLAAALYLRACRYELARSQAALCL